MMTLTKCQMIINNIHGEAVRMSISDHVRWTPCVTNDRRHLAGMTIYMLKMSVNVRVPYIDPPALLYIHRTKRYLFCDAFLWRKQVLTNTPTPFCTVCRQLVVGPFSLASYSRLVRLQSSMQVPCIEARCALPVGSNHRILR